MAETVGSLAVILTANTAKYTAGLEKSKNQTEKFGNTVNRTFSRVRVFAGAITSLVAAGGLAMLVKRSYETIDVLAKTSDMLGIATEKLGGLRHAAELSGVGASTLDMALQRMVRRISEAAQGTGEAVKALQELGLDAQALAAMAPDEQFLAIARAMQHVQNQSDRIRLAFKLFDSEGVKLLNTLGMGEEQLRATMAEAERLGIAINRVDAAKIELANDAITRMKAAFQGVVNTIAIALAPFIQHAADEMTAFATEGDRATKLVRGGLYVVARGIAVVADAIGHLVGMFKTLQLIGTSVVYAIIRAIHGLLIAVDEVSSALGLSSDLIKNAREAVATYADDLEYAMGDILDQMEEIGFNKWGKKVDEAFQQIRDSSTEAAEAIADSSDQLRIVTDDAEDFVDAVDAQADALRQLQSEAERVFEETRTPLEKYEAQIEKLRKLLAEGLIDQDTFSRAVKQAKETLDNSIKTEIEPVIEQAAEPKQADFSQVRLNRIALNGTVGTRGNKNEVEVRQLDKTNEILSGIARKVGSARVA